MQYKVKRYSKLATDMLEFHRELKLLRGSEFRVLKEIQLSRRTLKGVRGLDADNKLSDKLKGVGGVIMVTPLDPFQITTMTGVFLTSLGKLVEGVERKNMGIKDIVRYYRKMLIELQGF
jgi:hypothetical protein